MAIIELSSHNSDDILLSYTWKTNFEYNFFKSYFTLTDYGACSIIYPYLDFENPGTKNLTTRQYDGVTLYDKVMNPYKVMNHYLSMRVFAQFYIGYVRFFRQSQVSKPQYLRNQTMYVDRVRLIPL